jgi:DNA-binding response OmpR family regulator
MNDTKCVPGPRSERQEIAQVVVCEDDTATLELLCDHLAADRFGALAAPTASDALRLCRYNQPEPWA